jgi:hypothetical protein
MHLRHSRKLAVAIASIIALIAAGAALARIPSDPVAPEPTAPLYSRVLELGDLQGFWPTSCPAAVTAAATWARHSLSASMLTRNGFVNGLREPLRSRNSTMQATSAVAQYRTAQGARLASDEELARSHGSTGSFNVPSIPGAYGYSLTDNRTLRLGIAFSEGRFQYLLTVSGVATTQAATMRTRLVAAATGLYRKSESR